MSETDIDMPEGDVVAMDMPGPDMSESEKPELDTSQRYGEQNFFFERDQGFLFRLSLESIWRSKKKYPKPIVQVPDSLATPSSVNVPETKGDEKWI